MFLTVFHIPNRIWSGSSWFCGSVLAIRIWTRKSEMTRKKENFMKFYVWRAECSHWWIKFYWRFEFMDPRRNTAVFGQRSSFFFNYRFVKKILSSKTWIRNLNEKFVNRIRIWMQWSGSERLALRTGNWEKTVNEKSFYFWSVLRIRIRIWSGSRRADIPTKIEKQI